MEEKEVVTTDKIADALINMSENIGICDEETARGLRTSKKKDVLKSAKESSFEKFTKEIKKSQKRKDLGVY